VVDRFKVRAEEQIFGTRPFFTISGQSQNDTDEARQVNAFMRMKLDDKGKVGTTLMDSLTSNYIDRATVYKRVWVDENIAWADMDESILWDTQADKPVLAMNGGKVPGPVLQSNHKWIPKPDHPDQSSTGPKVLEQDPNVQWDSTKHEFRKPPNGIQRSENKYRGAKIRQLDHDAFLAPINARSLQESDITIELYDQDLPWASHAYIDRPWATLADYIAASKAIDNYPKSETERDKDPVYLRYREQTGYDEMTHRIGFVECWLRWDVLGIGEAQDFMVIIDWKAQRAIFYEYTASVCPDGIRPYVAISIAAARNRWIADRSVAEKVKIYNDYIDRRFSLETIRNDRNANPIGVVNTDAVTEQPDIIDASIDGGLYHAANGMSAKDFINYIDIPDLDTKTHQLIEFVMSMVQLWLGISNLSQGDTEGLPDNQTLGGVQAMIRESNYLGRSWIRKTARGFEEIILMLAKLQADNLNEDEAFRYLDGDDSVLATMSRQMIDDLDITVRVTVAEDDPAKKIASAMTAKAAVIEYMQFPANIQAAMRPLYEIILQNLGFNDVHRMLPDPGVAQLTMPGNVTPEPGSPQQTPPDASQGGAGPAPMQVAAQPPPGPPGMGAPSADVVPTGIGAAA